MSNDSLASGSSPVHTNSPASHLRRLPLPVALCLTATLCLTAALCLTATPSQWSIFSIAPSPSWCPRSDDLSTAWPAATWSHVAEPRPHPPGRGHVQWECRDETWSSSGGSLNKARLFEGSQYWSQHWHRLGRLDILPCMHGGS